MEKETKQGISGGALAIIIVLCIALGIASGYILNDKVLKKEDVTQNESSYYNNIKEEKNPKKSDPPQKENGTQSNEDDTTPNKTESSSNENGATDKVINTANICKNSNRAIYCNINYGPSFGNEISIQVNSIIENYLFTYESNTDSSYDFYGDNNALSDGNGKSTNALELEVFQIIFN